MEERNGRLREGLHMMYLGEIVACVSILGVLLVLIPVIGVLLMIPALVSVIVGGVMVIVGLAKLRNEHPDYKNALIATVAGMVASLFKNGDGGFATLMEVVSSVVSLFVIYFIIRATNQLLGEIEHSDIRELGGKAWKLELVSQIAGIVVSITSFCMEPSLPILVVELLVMVAISLAALVVYVQYLKQSSQAF